LHPLRRMPERLPDLLGNWRACLCQFERRRQRFEAELTALGGSFTRCDLADLPHLLRTFLQENNIDSVLSWEADHLPAGILEAVKNAGVHVTHVADPGASAGLAGALAAISASGTLMLKESRGFIAAGNAHRPAGQPSHLRQPGAGPVAPRGARRSGGGADQRAFAQRRYRDVAHHRRPRSRKIASILLVGETFRKRPGGTARKRGAYPHPACAPGSCRCARNRTSGLRARKPATGRPRPLRMQTARPLL
jgi:hypothetical protein